MGYLVFVSLLWSFSFPLIKGVLSGVDAAWISLIRLGLSLLVFIPFVRLRATGVGDAVALAAVGGVQFGVMYVLYIGSYAYLPAHMVVLLTTTTPLFVTLVNDGFERRLHGGFLVCALLAVAGGIVIRYPEQPLGANLRGVLLLQGSNLAFAFGQVMYKRIAARRSSWRDTDVFGYLYLGAAAVAGIWVLVRTLGGTQPPNLTLAQFGVLVYLGIVASGVGFFLWNAGGRRVNEGVLAIMNNVKIPLGVVASLLLLREQTDYVRLLAGAALIGAALFVNRRVSEHPRMSIAYRASRRQWQTE